MDEKNVSNYIEELKAKEAEIEAKERAAKYGPLVKPSRPGFFKRLLSSAGSALVWGTVLFFSTLQTISFINMVYPCPELKFDYDGCENWEPVEVLNKRS